MSIRQKLILSAFALLFSPLLLAQEFGGGDAVKSQSPGLPYREVTPINASESVKVVAVINFSCRICAQSHASLAAWGRTLPSPIVFSIEPAATDYDSALLAAVYYNTAEVEPAKADKLAAAFYRAIQEKGLKPTSPEFWKSVEGDFGKILETKPSAKKSVISQLDLSRKHISAYSLDATPSLIIGGRYVITTENTQGDQSIFLELANGLVSKVILDN